MDELTLKVEAGSEAHWYYANGLSQHTMESSDGTTRNTNLRDARKLGLFPSVTEVIKILANFGITKWYQGMLIEAAWTMPDKFRGESYTMFAERCYQDADQFGADAREFGSAIHEMIDRFHNDPDYVPNDQLLWPYFEKYKAWFKANIIRVIDSERTVVNTKYGYAGTMDLLAEHQEHGTVLIDFKTQNMKYGRPNYYDSWPLQLAAYRECIEPKPRCLSVVINSKEPMDPFEKLWSDQKTKTSWDVFRRCTEIWQLQRNYFPQKQEVPA